MGGLREIKMSFSNLEQKAAVHCRVLDYLMLLDTFFFFFVWLLTLAVLQEFC